MTKRHIHKYYKAYSDANNRNFLWTCALPDCTHHMPKHYEKSIHGKVSLCFKCENVITLDPVRLEMDKPLCDECKAISSSDPIPVPTNEPEVKTDDIHDRLKQLL